MATKTTRKPTAAAAATEPIERSKIAPGIGNNFGRLIARIKFLEAEKEYTRMMAGSCAADNLHAEELKELEIKLSKLLPGDFDDIQNGIDFAIARLRPLVEGDVERRQKEVIALKMLKNVFSSIFPAQIKLRFEGTLEACRKIEAAKKRMLGVDA
jgi:hypothetical protein